MPSPCDVGRSVRRLTILATCCAIGLAQAQELQIAIPGMERVPDFNQCRSDFDVQYEREMQRALKVIAVWEERIEDIGKARAQLEDNRLFFGLGPKADSEEAFDLSLGLRAVSLACDVLNEVFETMTPRAGILGRYTKRKFSALNVYNMLKSGEFMNDVMSSDGLGEALYVIFKEFGPLSPEVKIKLAIAENFKEAIEDSKAWEGYREDLNNGLRQLERDMRDAQERIRTEERRIREDLRKGFADFCALEKPPKAEDDGFESVAGQPVALPVAANDADPDGGPVRVVELDTRKNGSPLRGKVYVDHSQSFTGVVRYVAPEDFTGTESFRYAIVDDEGQRAWASVNVRVTRKPGDAAAKPAGAAATTTATSNPSQADLDAIWARCMDSPNITQCIDDGLAGKQGPAESGRLHPGCEQTRDLIAADQAEIERLEKEIARKRSTPNEIPSNMDYERIKILRWRIEETRRDGKAKWNCN